MEMTQKYIDVYTLEFMTREGEFVTDTVQAYSIAEARTKAERAYPGVRFRAFYPSGTAPVKSHPKWASKPNKKRRR